MVLESTCLRGVVVVNMRMACDGYWMVGCEVRCGRVPWGCVGSVVLVVGSWGRRCVTVGCIFACFGSKVGK
jgi:hypothetical protein